MSKSISVIKKEMQTQLAELRLKRKNIIVQFKKKLEIEKIKQIKDSIV